MAITFNIGVTDSTGATGSRSFTLDVTPAPTPTPTLAALTLSASTGRVGQAFSATVTGKTSGSTLTTNIAGLTVSGSTISGTPTSTGTLEVTETLTGATNSPRVTGSLATISAGVLNTLTLTSVSSTPGVGRAFTATIVGKTSGSTITTNIAGLTISGTSITGTPTAIGSLSLTESLANYTTLTTNDLVNISTGTLNTLSLTNATANPIVGQPFSATIVGKTAGSTITTNITGLVVSGTTISGTPTIDGELELIEELTNYATRYSTGLAVITTGAPAPTFSAIPTITGTRSVGATLTANNGTFTNGTHQGWQWYVGATKTTEIPGANGQTFVVPAGYANNYVSVRQTVSGGGGTASAISDAVQIIPGTLNALSLTGATTSPITNKPFSATIVGKTSGSTIATNITGLSISGTSITGTPTVSGSLALTETLTDYTTRTTSGLATIEAGTPPPTAWTVTAPPVGTVGQAYTWAPTITGGVEPYYQLYFVDGILPPGLVVNNDAKTVTGTPTTAGVYEDVIFQASDDTGDINDLTPVTFTINAAVPAPTITSLSTTTWPENLTMNYPLTANQTVTWSKRSGAQTALFGLTGSSLYLDAQDFETMTVNPLVCNLRATNTTTNLFTDFAFTLTITNEFATITNSPTAATVGQAYTWTPTFGGSSYPPYSGFGLVSGTLPPGLAISGTSITGTPTTSGTYGGVVFRITDDTGELTNLAPVSFTVAAAAGEKPAITGEPRTLATLEATDVSGNTGARWAVKPSSASSGYTAIPSSSSSILMLTPDYANMYQVVRENQISGSWVASDPIGPIGAYYRYQTSSGTNITNAAIGGLVSSGVIQTNFFAAQVVSTDPGTQYLDMIQSRNVEIKTSIKSVPDAGYVRFYIRASSTYSQGAVLTIQSGSITLVNLASGATIAQNDWGTKSTSDLTAFYRVVVSGDLLRLYQNYDLDFDGEPDDGGEVELTFPGHTGGVNLGASDFSGNRYAMSMKQDSSWFNLYFKY